MRPINKIIIHCSATREGQDVTVDTIRKWHLKRGFSDIGYHYVIYADGSVHEGRPLTKIGAHTTGFNTGSIGICYIGGLDKTTGKPKDTRTDAQKCAMCNLVKELIGRFPTIKEVKGHRDYSPDKNGNGKVDKWEWVKSCPCFDVEPWCRSVGILV